VERKRRRFLTQRHKETKIQRERRDKRNTEGRRERRNTERWEVARGGV
jgi:hypothetical protein